MDWQGVERLFEDEYTSGLIDRQVHALDRVAAACSAGVLVSDLHGFRVILSLATRAAAEHGAAFEQSCCALLRIVGKPYRRQKAHEERGGGATEELARVLACAAEALLHESAAICTEAASSLLSFTQANGFDAPTVAGGAGGGSDLLSAWVFHQQLLLRADCCALLVNALRQHVVRVLREWAPSGASRVASRVGGGADLSVDEARLGDDGTAAARPAQASGAPRPPPPPPHLRRMPEIVRALLQTLREMSESPECVAELVVAGLPILCVDLLRSAIELHDPATQEVVDLLWNMLEQTTPGASAKTPAGDAVAVTASHLLEKHRARSAAHALGTPEDISFLWQLVSNAAHHGYTDIDKQLRNDLVVILTLLARRHGNRPLFLGPTGVLSDLLAIVTAPELVGPGVHLLYGTHSAVDLEFKELLWGLVGQICQGEWSGDAGGTPLLPGGEQQLLEAQAHNQQQQQIELPALTEDDEYKHSDEDDEGAGSVARGACGSGDHSSDGGGSEQQQQQAGGPDDAPQGGSSGGWARVLELSPLVPAFLLYLDPMQVHSPYLAKWTPAQRRALELHVLKLLARFARPLVDVLIRSDGIAVLVSYLRTCSSVLTASVPPLLAPPADGGGGSMHQTHGADDDHLASTGAVDRASDPFLAPPPPAAKKAAGALRGSSPTATAAAAVVSDDPGRMLAALRVLLALLRVSSSAGDDPDAHADFRTLSHAVAPAPVRRALAAVQPTAHIGTRVAPEIAPAPSSADVPPPDQPGGIQFHEPQLPPPPHDDMLGWHVAAHLGDIGFVPHVLALLRSLDAGAAAAVAAAATRLQTKQLQQQATAGAVAQRDASTASLSPPRAVHHLQFTHQQQQRRHGGGSSTSGGGSGGGPPHGGDPAAHALATTALGASAALVAEYARPALQPAAAAAGVTLASSSYGPGLRAAAPPMDSAPGKDAVAPAALRELLLCILAALCDGAAAYASAALAASGGVRPPSQQQQQLGDSLDSDAYDSGLGGEPAATLSPQFVAEDAPLWTRLAANQDRVRAAGGIQTLLRTLRVCVSAAREGTLADAAVDSEQPRVATAALSAVRAAVLGCRPSASHFFALGGAQVLLDLAEHAPPPLRPLALTVLADLTSDPAAAESVRCWRSDATGATAVRMLLGLWVAEERRLGVSHEPETGALLNLQRPLDGAHAAARHAAALAVVVGPPPPASVSSPPPSERTLAEAASPGVSAEHAAAATDHAAFRTLRRALRAAELWRQADSSSTKGASASLTSAVSRVDLRHKIYAVLAGWNAAGVGAEDGVDTTGAGGGSDGEQLQHPLSGSDAPPLEPPDRVVLELVRSHEQVVVGSAWQDALERLAEAGVTPVDSDLAELQAHVARSAEEAADVRRRQLAHASAAVQRSRASEFDLTSRLVVQRDVQVVAQRPAGGLPAAPQSGRRSALGGARTLVGLTMDERKAAIERKHAMLAASFVGYKGADGAFVASARSATGSTLQQQQHLGATGGNSDNDATHMATAEVVPAASDAVVQQRTGSRVGAPLDAPASAVN